jgi:hypothetical protein
MSAATIMLTFCSKMPPVLAGAVRAAGVVEILEPVIVHVLAGVGAEGVDGERVAHAVHRMRQQRGRISFEFEHRPAGGFDVVVGRLRRIDQH